MLQCWLFTPESRPTFKYCLELLENLHQQNLRNPTTGAHEGQYISSVPECKLNSISNSIIKKKNNCMKGFIAG